jgi:hypothetical protein
MPAASTVFYRLNVQGSPPDPSLLLHLPFDNNFSDGVVVDASGQGNHGLRYGRPCCPTNWPTTTIGPDGSQAGLFRWYADGYGKYLRSGDYVGIPHVSPFLNMTQATISAWARFHQSYNTNYVEDQNSTILNSGHATAGVWWLGRNYSTFTSFTVFTNVTDTVRAVNFPDNSFPDGDTHTWNHYLVTFHQGEFRGYYNGICFVTNVVPVAALTADGTWMGIACWTFNKDPWLDLDVDLHPNNAWVNGTMDDIRVYNRALSAAEIEDLYYSYDQDSPTIPQALQARASTNHWVELRWTASEDPFRVAGYTVRRDGAPVGTIEGHLFVDTGLTPGASYVYTVEACDHAGHVSGPSAPLLYVAPTTGTPFECIVDNEDGLPWISYVGTWNPDCCWIAGAWFDAWREDGNADKGTKTATFRPLLPEAGEYEVFIRYVQRSNYASAVPVTIEFDGGSQIEYVNQRTGGGTWRSLGRYDFQSGTNAVVRVSNADPTGRVVVDAIRFTR